MVLPTDPALLDPAVATPAQHRGWHEEIHAALSESPTQPATIPAGSTGHLPAHDAIEPLIGSGLPTSYAEDDPSHGPEHHDRIHIAVNTRAIGNSGGPATISTGGTYSGVYESLNPAVPAVTIATTQAVTLDGAVVRHTGAGVFAQSTVNTNLTVQNSRFLALDPGSVQNARAVYLLQPATVTLDHNLFVRGHGVLINGNNVGTTLLRIRYNDYLDIGHWDAPDLVGAVHFDKVAAPNGALISWNRVTNHYGRSRSEDIIGMFESNGGGTSGTRIEVDHNLIDGSYPLTGDGAGFTGGGIDLGDSSGSWQVAHDNTVVRVTNNGLMIPAGSNLEHYSNRAVTSGIADNGSRVSSVFGNGLNLWDNPSYPGTPTVVSMHDNTGDHRRWTGSVWERSWQNTAACDPAGACTGNTNLGLSLTDAAAWLAEINDAIADWDTARVAAGIVVGPLT